MFLELEDVWAFEAAGRLAFVHSRAGRFDLDVTLSRLEAMLDDRFVRVHRSWVVNLPLVGAIERQDARMQLLVGAKLGRDGIRVPVSRSLAKATRARLLRGAVGIRLAR